MAKKKKKSVGKIIGIVIGHCGSLGCVRTQLLSDSYALYQ